MGKSLIIAEDIGLAALMDRGKAIEFFLQSSDFSLGDIYSARVENILPSIDAVFVNLGSDKMGFLHASDIPGVGPIANRVWPRQKILVQIVKEPTGNKGPRVSTDISLIGRFFILTNEHENVVLSRRISSPQERARLKAIATLLKPPVGFGMVIRTEAAGATDKELEEDFRDLFMERWKFVIDQFEIKRRPGLIFSDSRDLLYRTLRDVFHEGVTTVGVDNEKALERAKYYLEHWSNSNNPPETEMLSSKDLLLKHEVKTELENALFDRVELPSGGYIHIQPTEALTVIDVNSGKFTSSNNPEETILKTNIEAASEAARQMRLRNIGGVIVIDFIDMDNKADRLKVLEHFERLLDMDPAHPQIGRLSDLGLVELTRHRQEKSLFEALGSLCDKCHGVGWVFPIFEIFEDKAEENEPQGFEDESQNNYQQSNNNHYQHNNERPHQHNERRNERDNRDNRDRTQNQRNSKPGNLEDQLLKEIKEANRPESSSSEQSSNDRSHNNSLQEANKPHNHKQEAANKEEAHLAKQEPLKAEETKIIHNLLDSPQTKSGENPEAKKVLSIEETKPQEPTKEAEKEKEKEEVYELPTLTLEDSATKQVLPGIFSFDDNNK
ncbi:MAG TPA: Rne/Rng family ribonuclease [Vampirovibrionales bacterium]